MEKEKRKSGHQISQGTQRRQKWDERTQWRAPAVPHVVKGNSKDGATAARSSASQLTVRYSHIHASYLTAVLGSSWSLSRLRY